MRYAFIVLLCTTVAGCGPWDLPLSRDMPAPPTPMVRQDAPFRTPEGDALEEKKEAADYARTQAFMARQQLCAVFANIIASAVHYKAMQWPLNLTENQITMDGEPGAASLPDLTFELMVAQAVPMAYATRLPGNRAIGAPIRAEGACAQSQETVPQFFAGVLRVRVTRWMYGLPMKVEAK